MLILIKNNEGQSLSKQALGKLLGVSSSNPTNGLKGYVELQEWVRNELGKTINGSNEPTVSVSL